MSAERDPSAPPPSTHPQPAAGGGPTAERLREEDLNWIRAELVKGLVAEAVALAREEMARARRPEPLLTVKEVAERLRVSERTVENLVANGELRPVLIRQARRFDPRTVEAFIRANVAPVRRRTKRA